MNFDATYAGDQSRMYLRKFSALTPNTAPTIEDFNNNLVFFRD